MQIAAEGESALPDWARRLVFVFWWLFALATVIILPDDARQSSLSWAARAVVSPIAPLVLWLLLHAIRTPAREALRAVPLPAAVRFSLVGSVCGLALALRFATHRELAAGATDFGLTTGVYFAVYWVVLGSWILLRAAWAFSYHHVFWIGGVAFALAEENHAVARALANGDYLGGSLLLAYLIPTYGLPFAAAFLLVPPEDLPRARLAPGFVACATCAMLPLALYKYWGIAWHVLLGGPPC